MLHCLAGNNAANLMRDLFLGKRNYYVPFHVYCHMPGWRSGYLYGEKILQPFSWRRDFIRKSVA